MLRIKTADERLEEIMTANVDFKEGFETDQ